MVTEQGRPSWEVAKELGICNDTLHNWLKAAEAPSPEQVDRQNRLARNFPFTQPNKAWIGDITYIPTDEGWLISPSSRTYAPSKSSAMPSFLTSTPT